MSSPLLGKPFIKSNILRWSLNCSVTAFILSVISIMIASYALSFNLLPVPVKYAKYFSAKDPTTRFIRTPPSVHNLTDSSLSDQPLIYDSAEVRAMQSSFLSKFFQSRMVIDDTTVIFQSVPLCGGDILPGLVEKLLAANGKRRFAHVAEFTEQYPSLPNNTKQTEAEQLDQFMRDFIARSPKPLFLYVERPGKVPFIKGSNIHYISLICDPTHRLIENYRVDHMSDEMQFALPPGMRMRTEPVHFDACFKHKLPECYGYNVQTFILQHFCTDSRKCHSYNLNKPLESALATAKQYAAIGLLEEFQAFLKSLEQKLPKYFGDVSEIFAQDDEFEGFRSKRGPLEGVSRPKLTHETFNDLQKHIWPDYGFYWETRKMFML